MAASEQAPPSLANQNTEGAEGAEDAEGAEIPTPTPRILSAHPQEQLRKKALQELAEQHFEIKEQLSDQQYLSICNLTKDLHDLNRDFQAPSTTSTTSIASIASTASAFSSVRMFIEGIGQAQEENEELRRENLQLTRRLANQTQVTEDLLEDQAVTTQSLDRLKELYKDMREKKRFFSRTNLALKGLVDKYGITDGEVLHAYAQEGVLDQVLEVRAKRKRANEEAIECDVASGN